MIKVGIIGGSGLTGRELIRIILRHAKASISYVTSRHYAGTKVSAVFPEFASMYDGSFIDPSDPKVFSGVDAVFVCLPHTEAMEFVNNANGRGIRVIDLSADYRIKDAKVYETWYKQPHKYPELLKRAVYGMPEINREAIRKADIVANTGCYANCTMLGVLPALSKFKVESIISDAKSGVSGAGIKAKDSSMYININENDTPYSVGRRHSPRTGDRGSTGVGNRKKGSADYDPAACAGGSRHARHYLYETERTGEPGRYKNGVRGIL